jgi:hypothetical protein
MRITIEDAAGGIEEIKAAVVAALLNQRKEDLDLLTPAQACGILNVSHKALSDMKIDRVDLLNNGSAIRYKCSVIAKALEERTVKGAKSAKK